MSERPDHFARMRSEETPDGDPPEGAPEVSPALIEWLLRQFPRPPPSLARTLDECVAAASLDAAYRGQLQLIDHLNTLVRKDR